MSAWRRLSRGARGKDVKLLSRRDPIMIRRSYCGDVPPSTDRRRISGRMSGRSFQLKRRS
jgi:hypothetical protein